MGASRLFVHLSVALWGAAVVYGCATGGDEASDDCSIGSEGCDCTIGGGCDPDLMCLSGFCVDAGAMGGSTSAPNAGVGGTSAGGAPTTGPTSVGNTTTTVAATSSPAATTTTTTTGSGMSCPVPPPTGVSGCTTCGACDTWSVSWDPVATATHYEVEYVCSISTYQSPNILDTDAELCFEVGMCSHCPFTIGGIWVKACDGTCCSAGTMVDIAETPLSCGGDCCV